MDANTPMRCNDCGETCQRKDVITRAQPGTGEPQWVCPHCGGEDQLISLQEASHEY